MGREARKPRARRCGRCVREGVPRMPPPEALLGHVVGEPPTLLVQGVGMHLPPWRVLPWRLKALCQQLPARLGVSDVGLQAQKAHGEA
jgi:hypothetical protein